MRKLLTVPLMALILGAWGADRRRGSGSWSPGHFLRCLPRIRGRSATPVPIVSRGQWQNRGAAKLGEITDTEQG